ncbi:glycoside hydrolase family 28 protein [Asticcacaulis sp.]|uniref:glycoside hydrolase family 28 protein n=1 Tax=Asticcacaulis sp. TaxID=1872648 RepID=UPI00391AE4FA
MTRLCCLAVLPTALCLELDEAGIFAADAARDIFVNERLALQTDRNVFSLYDLKPDSVYEVRVGSERLVVRTAACKAVLDPRAFGAKGDGISDDTSALQAALSACPPGGLVRISAGRYLTAPLFLKSDIAVELGEGAELLGHREISRWPVLPGLLPDSDGVDRTCLGSWEGEAEPCHAALLNFLFVHNVQLYGRGMVDGQAGFDTWWARPKARFTGWRPRLVFMVECEQVILQGITLKNSPSWTVHPLFSRGLTFADLSIEAPSDSPNTDGLNPESSTDIVISGVDFAVGDDCIALKSGKISMARRNVRPTRRVRISNCRMKDGHGAVVIGSEMACGIYDVSVQNCLFINTDRGIRLKTRRGRGRDAVVRGLDCRHLRMEGVGTAFVINSFYWCDPDGKTDCVADRNPRPVDDGTPSIGDIHLSHIDATGVRHAGLYVLGLPEQPVEGLTLDHIRLRFDTDAQPGEPDMAASIAPVARLGGLIANVKNLYTHVLDIEGQKGETLTLENVTCLT